MGYRLCVFASSSVITEILSCITLIRLSFLHFGQNKGKFLSSVSLFILLRVERDERRFDFHDIGLAIKQAREASGMTQEQLAYIVDRAPRTIMYNEREKTVNQTDPDAGILKRPGKPEGPHYLSHQSVDSRHGIIVDVEVTPGNVNDSHPYLERIEYMRNHLGLLIEAAGADKAYGRSLICRRLQEMVIRFYTPRVASGIHYQAEFTRKEFQYEEETDSFVCPGGKRLVLRSLEREEYNNVGPKLFPGAAPRRFRFGHSSTNNRNGGQYGYYQSSGLLPVLYIGLLHGSIGRSC